eukprot:15350981-Ditylum_brightwellii.AAC.1
MPLLPPLLVLGALPPLPPLLVLGALPPLSPLVRLSGSSIASLACTAKMRETNTHRVLKDFIFQCSKSKSM